MLDLNIRSDRALDRVKYLSGQLGEFFAHTDARFRDVQSSLSGLAMQFLGGPGGFRRISRLELGLELLVLSGLRLVLRCGCERLNRGQLPGSFARGYGRRVARQPDDDRLYDGDRQRDDERWDLDLYL